MSAPQIGYDDGSALREHSRMTGFEQSPISLASRWYPDYVICDFKFAQEVLEQNHCDRTPSLNVKPESFKVDTLRSDGTPSLI